MEQLMEMIKTSRNLSDTTLRTYMKTLQRLKNNVKEQDVEQFLKRWEPVLSNIKNNNKKPYQINLLSAYIVALDSYNQNIPSIDMQAGLVQLRKYQMKVRNELDKTKYAQSKSEKEEKNWTTYENLQLAIKKNLKVVNKILKRNPEELEMKEAKTIMLWIISNLYASGKENPPPRLDFNNMIIIDKKDYEEGHDENQNYLVVHSSRTKYFIFAQYKTVSKYGKKSIKLAPVLNRMINKWMQLKTKIKGKPGTSKLLLFNNKGNAIEESSMSVYVSDAFISTGKHITANLIRHIFISDVANKLPLAERKKIADAMGHSLEMSLIYEKN